MRPSMLSVRLAVDAADEIDTFYNLMRANQSHLGGVGPEHFGATHTRGGGVSTESRELRDRGTLGWPGHPARG